MKFSKFRGAITAAALTFVTLFGTEGSALAQNDLPTIAAPVDAPAETIRFVAQEVVQPLAADITAIPTPQPPMHDSLRQLVGDMPVEVELSADLTCLAQAIYFEARGEPLDGQLAVARVIMNRAASGLYPADYCGVVRQPSQFSFVKRGRIPAADQGSTAWARAKALAQIAHQDLWDSQADDALYFHARYVKPGWARSKVQLAQIDTHIFYR